MSLSLPGVNTLVSEVTGIDRNGFWLLVHDAEYFVSFDDYPIFRTATVEQIYDLQYFEPGQLCWPGLDADIELEALEHPERFPLAFVESK